MAEATEKMDAGGSSKLGSRKLSRPEMSHAQLRFHYPRMSNTPVPDEEKLRRSTNIERPMPVIVKHGWEKAPGVIEGDHHSKNTNPGFSRNILGGFYTQ